MTGEYTDRVLDELKTRRLERQALLFVREREMREDCPEMKDIDVRIAGAALRDRASLPGLRAEREKAVSQWLKSHGRPEEWLNPPFSCAQCEDTGYVSGRLCPCVRNETARRMFSEAGLTSCSPSFESFDFNLFPDNVKLPGGHTVRSRMQILRDYGLRYADSFPEPPLPNLLFTGKPGLGKSYLLDCIAGRVIARGHWVVRATAFSVNDVMAKALFDRADPDSLFECDLLALDDLGSEPILNKVTISSLFNLLNERMIHARPFVISTNLTPEEILNRYGDRVFSRMTDSRTTGILKFEGVDLRRGF